MDFQYQVFQRSRIFFFLDSKNKYPKTSEKSSTCLKVDFTFPFDNNEFGIWGLEVFHDPKSVLIDILFFTPFFDLNSAFVGELVGLEVIKIGGSETGLVKLSQLVVLALTGVKKVVHKFEFLI